MCVHCLSPWPWPWLLVNELLLSSFWCPHFRPGSGLSIGAQQAEATFHAKQIRQRSVSYKFDEHFQGEMPGNLGVQHGV